MIRKSGFRFSYPDFRFCNPTKNPKTGFKAEISPLRFAFFPFFFFFFRKSEKGFEKLFLRTAVLHVHV